MKDRGEQSPPTPLELFDKKTRELADFDEYLRLLTHEGVPAILAVGAANETQEEQESRLVRFVSVATAQVLKIRKEQGLANDPESLWGRSELFEEEIQETIPDGTIRVAMAVGLIKGLANAQEIPPWRLPLLKDLIREFGTD